MRSVKGDCGHEWCYAAFTFIFVQVRLHVCCALIGGGVQDGFAVHCWVVHQPYQASLIMVHDTQPFDRIADSAVTFRTVQHGAGTQK